MPEIPAEFITIIIIFASSFVLLLLGFVLTYFWLIKKYLNLQHDSTNDKIKRIEESRRILEEAHITGARIVADARQKASQILSSAQSLNTENAGVLAASFEKASQDYLIAYKDALRSVTEKSNLMLLNISNDIKTDAKSELTIFRSMLREEVVKMNGDIKNDLAEIFKEAQKEADEYKKSKLAELDMQIVKMVEEVTKNVVGKVLSLDEHEKLILKALDEAKKQQVF